MRLFEGAIGPTRLAQATATACLDSQQRLAFDCHLEPAQARQTGHVKLSGSLPLTFTDQPNTVVSPSFIHSCMHAFVCLSVHASIHPSVLSFVCSFIHSLTHSLTPSFFHSFVCSFARLFIHSFMHSVIHAFFECLPLGSGMTVMAVRARTVCRCFLKI